ncbi:MAG: response regulator [Desulfobacteraceae bacterium]|jgi:DNA-binding NtrC family response regulator
MDLTKNMPKILVVDDDAKLAANLLEYLSRLGYRAEAAHNGKEALELYAQGDFTVVVTDLMMPEMDGMELLSSIRKVDPDALVIMLTGYGTIESAVNAIKAGAFDYITKPLKLQEIEVTIQRAMERDFIFNRMRWFRSLFFFSIGILAVCLVALLVFMLG